MANRVLRELAPVRLDNLTARTLRAIRRLNPAQRHAAVMRILEDDADLAAVLPALRATITAAHRIRLPLRRDGVS